MLPTKPCRDCGEPKPVTTHSTRCGPCEALHRKRNGDGIYDRIARSMGITRQRVHQIEASALRKLREGA